MSPDNLPQGLSTRDLDDDLHFCCVEDDEAEIEKGEHAGDVERDDAD